MNYCHETMLNPVIVYINQLLGLLHSWNARDGSLIFHSLSLIS